MPEALNLSPVARDLAPAGLRSGPNTLPAGYPGTPRVLVLRRLRHRTGASSLATVGCSRLYLAEG